MFNTPDRNEHRRKRKVVGQVISDRSLRAFSPIMSEQINIFLQQLLQSSQRHEAVNLTPLCRNLSIDIVGYLSFGHALNTQTESTNRFFYESMAQALYMNNLTFHWPALSIASPLLKWLGRKKVEGFRQFIHDMIVSRMAEPKDAHPDFYSVVAGDVAADDDADSIRASELWGEAIFFVAAGGTTVATAACGVFFHLSRHPATYARLASEIRGAFASGRDIVGGPTLLASCRYLRAVIDESLRLASPSLGTLWRTLDDSAKAPMVVDGHVIPRGTEVGMHVYSVLHNPDYYPEPFAFRPERWLGPEEDGGAPDSPEKREVRTRMRRAQVYFGLGDRGCLGKTMAYLETSLIIAWALWYFDFEKAPGEAGMLGAGREGSKEPWGGPDQFQLRDIFIGDHDGPNLVFKPRGEHWRELMEKA